MAPTAGAPSKVVARISTGGNPCGVVTAAGFTWVTDAKGGKLLKIDPARNAVVASVALDPKPCELQSALGSLWIVTQSGSLDRVDPKAMTVTAHIPIGLGSYESIYAFGSVWVSNRDSATVTQVNPGSNKAVATITLEGTNPGGITATGDSLWIGNDMSGATFITRLDPKSKKTTHVTTGTRPGYVTALSGSVWASDVEDGTVTQIDARTGARRGTLPAGLSPVNLAGGGGAKPEVWVPDDQGDLLTRIDALTGTVLERLATARGPAVVTVTDSQVWVTNYEAGSVWRIAIGQRP